MHVLYRSWLQNRHLFCFFGSYLTFPTPTPTPHCSIRSWPAIGSRRRASADHRDLENKRGLLARLLTLRKGTKSCDSIRKLATGTPGGFIDLPCHAFVWLPGEEELLAGSMAVPPGKLRQHPRGTPAIDSLPDDILIQVSWHC